MFIMYVIKMRHMLSWFLEPLGAGADAKVVAEPALEQREPPVRPVRKAMDQENHLLTGTGILIEDLMSPEFGRLPLLVPRSQSVTYSHDFPVLVQKV